MLLTDLISISHEHLMKLIVICLLRDDFFFSYSIDFSYFSVKKNPKITDCSQNRSNI